MNLSSSRNSDKSLSSVLSSLKPRPGMVFGLIILSALIAFEIFNYTTTDYALRDLLGGLEFAGISWATILTLAFCAIDFAGIARLFSPEQSSEEPRETYFLLGAWLLAATMNAVLTWWGVSMAIASHTLASTAVIDQKTLIDVVPVFVALLVWIIRILIIGSLSFAGERIFTSTSVRPAYSSSRPGRSMPAPAQASPRPASLTPRQPVSRPGFSNTGINPRPEPTYHNMQARGYSQTANRTSRDTNNTNIAL